MADAGQETPNYLDAFLGTGSAIGGGLLTVDAYNKLGDIGDDAYLDMKALGQQLQTDSAFKPYSVTTATGSQAFVDESGGVTQALSPEEQAMQNMLMSQASGLFGQAAAPMAETEQAVFDRMMAVQDPAAERERLALENRLRAQGRLGLSADAYGGSSPELLAFQTAQAEARNNAALAAMQQARQDQMQQANLATAFQGASYMPQTQLLAGMQPSLTTSGIAQQGQLTGVDQYGSSVASGLSAQVAARQGQANLSGNLGATMLSSAANTATGDDGWVSALGDVLGEIFN